MTSSAASTEAGAHRAVLSGGWLAAVRGLVRERAVDIVVDPVGGGRMTDSPGHGAGRSCHDDLAVWGDGSTTTRVD